MTPERFQRLGQLYHAALEREPETRAAFLDDACAGDEELRSQIESLLRADDHASSFLNTPALNLVAEIIAEGASLEGRTISHYKLIRKIGEGGMGEVYLAEDTRIGRKVAIKALPADTAADEHARKRLLREARAAATIDHPNVCTIHEVAEEEGLSFIVMQYVEGETLARRIQHKPLPPADAVDVAGQVADALSEAHSRGIIHRDIKPHNIMITPRGQAKVMDFGLARVITQSPTADSLAETKSMLTGPGMILGTLAYMSPEQVRGESLDPRSDIFSFGCVFYEMIAGRRPFDDESTAVIISSILTQEPPPLARYAGVVSPEIQRIISKCLAKDRRQRYQSALDLLIDLRNLKRDSYFKSVGSEMANTRRHAPGRRAASLVPTLLVVVSLIAGLYYFILRGGAEDEPIDSIAVLPMVNASDNPDTEYLSDGITENIINSLSQASKLRVAARTTVFRYKGRDVDPQVVGRDLNVRAVLSSKVLYRGDTLIIQADLVDTADGRQLWGEQYNRKQSDILAVQEEIARRISEKLRLKLTGEERERLIKHPTENTEAYQLYLKGRYSSNRWTEEGFRKAIEFFNQALTIDPDYALAYSGMADSYYGLSSITQPPKSALAKLREMAIKAVALDDGLAEAHNSLSLALVYHDWDWSGAERESRRAIELDPNNPQFHLTYGDLLSSLGRFDESTYEFKKAQGLDPTSPVNSAILAYHYIRLGDYDRAMSESQKALELEPNHNWPLGAMGWAYLYKGEPNKALEVFQKLKKLNEPGSPSGFGLEGIGRAYAAMGNRVEALKVIDNIKEAFKGGYVPSFPIATIYLALGEKDKAMELLEKAYEGYESVSLAVLKTDRQFDVLRTDPRFIRLLRRLNFEP